MMLTQIALGSVVAYVTYPDLIQFCIMLIGFCALVYQISNKK